jgi:hypothetical protein
MNVDRVQKEFSYFCQSVEYHLSSRCDKPDTRKPLKVNYHIVERNGDVGS